MHVLSNRWLGGFKRRRKITQYNNHGEAGSHDSAEFTAQMKVVPELVDQYESKDIFNLDETALYWKMSPAKGLAHQRLAGTKKAKAGLTLA